MLSGLFKLILLVVVIVAVGTFFLGWNLGGGRVNNAEVEGAREAVGTTGETAAGQTREAGREAGAEAREAGAEARQAAGTAAERGREAGAAIGERAGQAAQATQNALADGTLTTKIKAKMGLDDTVKALNLDVDTTAGVVTLTGVVRSEQERQRAVQLARETQGVKQVVDKLTVR